MEGALDTGGTSWASWFQQAASGVIDKASTAAFVKPYDVQELELRQLGQGGYYREGQPGTRPPVAGLSVSPTLLLLAGAAVVAVLLLRK